MDIYAVLPVKDMEHAKQRLAGYLTQLQRQLLMHAMLEDVLETLVGATGLAGLLVITQDARVRSLAVSYGAGILFESGNEGHSVAVERAATVLNAEGVAGLLQLPADVPRIQPDDIDAIIASHRKAPAITITPSHNYLGSNAVLCTPPNVLPFGFGYNSFNRHLRRARDLDITATVVQRPNIALDIDTGDDLRRFLEQPSNTHTWRVAGTFATCKLSRGYKRKPPIGTIR